MDTPGHDIEQLTGMTAGGAQMYYLRQAAELLPGHLLLQLSK